MKIIKIILTILIIIQFSSVACAQDTIETTVEVHVNQLFTNLQRIISSPLEEYTVQNMHKAMDYSIEILKIAPGTLAAYCTLGQYDFTLKYRFGDKAKEKYKQLKYKYLDDLENFNDDVAERLIFMTLLYEFDPENDKNYAKNRVKCLETLKKMKDECQNKDYAALALAILLDRRHDKYNEEFMQRYPNHPAIPLIELGNAMSENYQESIEKILKLAEKYKDVIMPDGIPFKVDCYSAVSSFYYEIGNKEMAQKYFEKIEKEHPDYIYLNELKEKLTPKLTREKLMGN